MRGGGGGVPVEGVGAGGIAGSGAASAVVSVVAVVGRFVRTDGVAPMG